MNLPAEPRFLITRLTAVGDCIHTLPLACALRDRFPRGQIAWVVEGISATLLAGHPAIDQLFALPRRFLRSPRQALSLRKQLRDWRPDIVLDPQSLTKSALAGWLSGARRRIGFASPQGRELAPWLAAQTIRPAAQHVIDRYLELLRPLGISLPAVRYGLVEQPAERATINRFLRGAHLGCPFAVINPGAGWDSKLWPVERYGRLARFLGQRCNLPAVVAWAGPREKAWAEQIAAGAGGHAIVAPQTSLLELAALLRSARLFVGGDTGPMHLAAAVGTPCVALFGPTLPEVCGPYGRGHISLQSYYQSGSSRQRRSAENLAMQAITLESVCDACLKLLDRPSLPRAQVA